MISARLKRLAQQAPLGGVLEALIPVLRNSRSLGAFLLRHPEALSCLRPSRLHEPLNPQALIARVEELSGVEPDEERLSLALRQGRSEALLRICARDVLLSVPLEETCRALSLLAEGCLEIATAFALKSITAKLGPPLDDRGREIPFVVMGMGKLGGWELNYSSDVDLIYFYGCDVEGSHAHFCRVSEIITRLLHQRNAEGFVFRVDLRLRPEGQSGPLCNSLLGAERYYEAWGRLWERMAWLRARPVAGDLTLGRELLKRLEPWIHRRSLDANTLEGIRALRDQILRRHRRDRSLWGESLDLKLDEGGIRALEFFVQTLQIIHSGRQPLLRDPSTLGGLRRLQAQGLLDAQAQAELAAAYRLFRRVEHRIQMEEERQLHRLPQGEALMHLALRLGFPSDSALLERLDLCRAQVSKQLCELLGGGQEEEPERLLARAALSMDSSTALRLKALMQGGLRDPEQALQLLRLAGRRPTSPFSLRAPSSGLQAGVDLLTRIFRSYDPDKALNHLTAFISTVARRPQYLSSLAERPALAGLLINLFASSDLLSEALIRRPSLVDDLYSPLRAESYREELRRFPLGVGREALLEGLALFRLRETLKIGLADLAGLLKMEELEARLTALAEAILEVLIAQALEVQLHRPRGSDGAPLDCAVLAMGKLGGRAMSYGSDLDIQIIYEDPPDRGSEALAWFGGFARQLISLLGLPTRAGALYQVDTRLRPGGRQGTLVTRLGRFREYHQRAAPWERLALVRARPISGAPPFRETLIRTLESLTYEHPLPPNFREEIRKIRLRIERELAREKPGRYNPKLGRGGLVEIEFITQLFQIEQGADPRLRSSNTVSALQRLSQQRLLPCASRLLSAWRFLRNLEHRLRMERGRAVTELRDESQGLQRIAKRLGYGGEAGEPAQQLLRDYQREVGAVRECFEMVFTQPG